MSDLKGTPPFGCGLLKNSRVDRVMLQCPRMYSPVALRLAEALLSNQAVREAVGEGSFWTRDEEKLTSFTSVIM